MSDISILRIQNQQIASSCFNQIADLVSWMGAMQAQDYTMMKWAVGLRAPETINSVLEESVAKGEVLRTHLLRPTWHLVSSSDINWILELTAPHVRTQLKTRLKQLEVDESIISKAKTILEKELAGANHQSRDEIISLFEKEGILALDLRASHILMACELDGLICSGVPKAKKQTYALLDERSASKEKIAREEALFRLAERYFSSHGPATLHDFIWWSGLPIRDARKAIEMVKNKLDVIRSNGRDYLFLPSFSEPKEEKKTVFLMPAYDEFLISYCDRTDALETLHNKKAISSNGIFRPTVVINGKVAGLWKKVAKKNAITVEYDFFRTIHPSEKKLIAEAEEKYLSFISR